MEVAFQCPANACQRMFIAEYNATTAHGGLECTLKDIYPRRFVAHTFDDEVRTLSNDFCNIFNQASAAENYGLDQVCGPGYRKALEFLIKDYLCSKDAKNAETIKATALGVCIKDHVADANVKRCADLATWLGNDETHYVRKWTDRGLADLKTLIRLTLHWIQNELLTTKYQDSMRKDQPPKPD